MLRKRLKLLFEPLVQSLGDSADNISFLLRMVETLGKNYRPVDVSAFGVASSRPSIESPADIGELESQNEYKTKRDYVLQEKLKMVCGAAREVLLSFVKKDVNLTPYPGTVHIPRTLFQRIGVGLEKIPKGLTRPSLKLSRKVGLLPMRSRPSLWIHVGVPPRPLAVWTA